MYKSRRVCAVIPAYNEAPSITRVVSELVALRHMGIPVLDAVVVCDNASSDDTAQLASTAGASVVYESRSGYGYACLKALAALPPCDVVLFVDGDYSVHTHEVLDLLAAYTQGYDLVIGARVPDRREPGALTPHQILGNKIAAFLLRLRWQKTVSDLGPFRAISHSALDQLKMAEPTFGWTMEMQAKALALGLQTVEVPVHTRRRIGESKVSGTWRGSIGAGWGILSTFAKIGMASEPVRTRLSEFES